jgi:16S rRNA (cytosine967-C5)-methyltransferase
VIETNTTAAALDKKADKLLLDVPCSGLGVLKRNPDAKWKLNLSLIDKTKAIQAEILNAYCDMLKPNGTMVYSTCSILPSENGEQVQAFLKSHPNFELLEERSIFPSEGFDGFYMARLKRTT